MKTVAIPFAMQIPVLSTRHLPHAYALDPGCLGFMRIHTDETTPWIKPIAKWAQSNVYEWVRFDDDGDVVDGLEVYDWEAGDGRALAFNAVLNMPLSESFKLPAGAIIFASDLTPPDIKAQRDTYEVFNIPRLPPPTQAEIDAFDAASNKPAVACNETVIHGTHRNQDLIPCFLDLLSQLAPDAYAQVLAQPFGPIPAYVQDEGDSSDWWTSEDAYSLRELLFDELGAHAPPGFYFGTHPGDGSDFGFWNSEEDES